MRFCAALFFLSLSTLQDSVAAIKSVQFFIKSLTQCGQQLEAPTHQGRRGHSNLDYLLSAGAAGIWSDAFILNFYQSRTWQAVALGEKFANARSHSAVISDQWEGNGKSSDLALQKRLLSAKFALQGLLSIKNTKGFEFCNRGVPLETLWISSGVITCKNLITVVFWINFINIQRFQHKKFGCLVQSTKELIFRKINFPVVAMPLFIYTRSLNVCIHWCGRRSMPSNLNAARILFKWHQQCADNTM